jgi:hypothetical protein
MSMLDVSFHLHGVSEMCGIMRCGGDFDISPCDGQAKKMYSIHLKRLDHFAAQTQGAGVWLSFHGRGVSSIPGGGHTLCQRGLR